MSVPSEFLTPEQKGKFFQQCNSEECQVAVARLNSRNAILVICNDISVWSSVRSWYAAMAATAFAAALASAIAAAATIATIIGIPLAGILWVAAIIFLAIGLLLSSLAINAALQY